MKMEAALNVYLTAISEYLLSWKIFPGIGLCDRRVLPFHRRLVRTPAMGINEELRFAVHNDISFLESIQPSLLSNHLYFSGIEERFHPVGEVVYHRHGCNLAMVQRSYSEHEAEVSVYIWLHQNSPGGTPLPYEPLR